MGRHAGHFGAPVRKCTLVLGAGLAAALLMAGCWLSSGPKTSTTVAESLGPKKPACEMDATRWVADTMSSVLLDQQAFLCSCLPMDLRDTQLHLAVKINGEGKITTDMRGIPSTLEDSIECLSGFLVQAAANWLALQPGWYSSLEPVQGWTNVAVDELLCSRDELEAPIRSPVLSEHWLSRYPERVFEPDDVPPEECYPVLRTNVRAKFRLVIE